MSTPFHACYFAYELTRRRPAAVADRLKSCTIPTLTPNAVTSAVHDRMPVILDRDSYDLWLDPGMTDFKVVSEMLKPYDAQLMRSYPLSGRVNHVVNDDAECSTPVEIDRIQTQMTLF